MINQKNKDTSEYIYSPNSRLTKLRHKLRKYYKVISAKSHRPYLNIYDNDYKLLGNIVYDEELNKPWGFILVTWDIGVVNTFKHYEYIMNLDGYEYYRIDCSDI